MKKNQEVIKHKMLPTMNVAKLLYGSDTARFSRVYIAQQHRIA